MTGVQTCALPIFFLGRLDDSLYRSAYSFVPQATVADLINRAFAYAEAILEPEGCFPILSVHDEICFSCPIENVGQAIPKIKNLLEYPIQVKGVDVPLVIPVEIKVGPNWYDCTQYNPTQTSQEAA